MHHDPGYLLGGAVIAGTFVAALAVRREAVYQLIPVPALAYMVGALTAGLIHQQSAAPSRSGLAVSATQWVAGGFVTMAAATAVAAAITVIRWLMNRRAGRIRNAAAARAAGRGPADVAERVTLRSRGGSVGRAPAQAIAAAHGRATPRTAFLALARGAGAAAVRRASRREPPPPADPYSRRRSAPWPEPPSRPGPPSLWHAARLNADEPTRG